MDQTTGSAKGPVNADCEYVLGKYLELFNSNGQMFKYFIAKNVVLQWFGRTVKGQTKVHDFLRYEVSSQYDHLFFETAKISEPIECKPSHFETKKFPTEQNVIKHIHSPDIPLASNLTDSPTRTSTTIFDEEINIIKERRASMTPPLAKRFKHDEEHDLNRSVQPLLNIDDYFDRKDIKSVHSISHSLFSTPKTTTVQTNPEGSSDYSELRYLDTIGILRSCTQPKHRGFRNSSAVNVNDTWDREARIRVSYRIRLQDNDIQFALIIYQNPHPYSVVSKRNLMTEFNEVATPGRVAMNPNSNPRPLPTPQQVKRKIGRRLKLL